jgi:hypothetical protein
VRVRPAACRASLAWAGIASIALAAAWLAPGEAKADVYTQASLDLQIDGKLTVGELVTVTASGTAPPGLAVWAYVDPQGEACPPTAFAQPEGAIVIASGVAVGEQFAISGGYRPDQPGPDSFCAYLGPSVLSPTVTVATAREVLRTPLRAGIARRSVATALERHGFARRVVRALETHCHRRALREFRCRFSARFPGYELSGHGRVRRIDDRLTYRFKVRAQGERFVLTQRNEGHLP